MYYIFNKDGSLLGTCDFEPNTEDLQSRNEYFVINNDQLDTSRVVGGKYGGIYESIETPEEVIVKETKKIMQQRNKILASTDWITTRHFEEKMLGKETTFSDIQVSEFLIYRQELRDITKLEDFPLISLPETPKFLE
ncbi:MAG: phage tail assembly chaperone [Bacteroidales bacterium]